jgi:hypothetical protein
MLSSGKDCVKFPPGNFAGETIRYFGTNFYQSSNDYCKSWGSCPRCYMTPCPVGTFSEIAGADSIYACKPAPPGSYANISGASSFTLCPKGTYSNFVGSQSLAISVQDIGWAQVSLMVGASSPEECLPCSRGYYAPVAGSTECKLIPPGAFASDGTTLQWCPENTFSAIEGATEAQSCHPCPAGSTSVVGASVCSSSPRQDFWGWVFGTAIAIVAFLYYMSQTLPLLYQRMVSSRAARDSPNNAHDTHSLLSEGIELSPVHHQDDSAGDKP